MATLLFLSAGIRMGGDPGAAIANEVRERTANLFEGGARSRSDQSSTEEIADQLMELLEETREMEAALAQKEAELQARAQALALVEDSVRRNLTRLEEAEKKLSATIAKADQASENDIARLTVMYENMKPEESSALFQLMEPSFAAGFLARMRSDAAAAILAGLTPELAYTISVVLAGRNAEVPRESKLEQKSIVE